MNISESASIIPNGWDTLWVENSVSAVVLIGNFTKLLYFAIALSAAIIIHSWTIHKFKFRILRICTEVAAWSTILQCALYLYCTDMEATDDYVGNSCSARLSAYLMNAVGTGLASTLIQMCDNYVIFHRYVVITGDKSLVHRVLVGIFVLVFLYATFWPFITFLPWLINMNTPFNTDLMNVYMYQYIFFPSYILYDVFYTSFVIHKLYQLMHNSVSDSNRKSSFRILVIKTILHNLISISAAAIYSFYLFYGYIIFDILLVVSLHLCLNWKFENMFIRKGSVFTRLSSVNARGALAIQSQVGNVSRKVSSVA